MTSIDSWNELLAQPILITVWDDFPEDGLNADDKAAKASALCLGPP